MTKKKNTAVLTNPTADTFKDLISTEHIFSVDTRGLPITIKMFQDRISLFNRQATELHNLAGLGFYRIGQLLLKAEPELGANDYKKLTKKLEEDGLHKKAQQRYRRIANNQYINDNWTRLPKAWTFWENLNKVITDADGNVDDEKVKEIDHLINNDAKWSEIELALNLKKKGGTQTALATGKSVLVTELNVKDNHNEIYGIEFYYKVGTQKHKASFDEFEKDLKDLNKRYPFIKLKQKNAYLRAVKEILAGDTVKDDTSIKKKGGEKIETFKQSFSVKFTDI